MAIPSSSRLAFVHILRGHDLRLRSAGLHALTGGSRRGFWMLGMRTCTRLLDQGPSTSSPQPSEPKGSMYLYSRYLSLKGVPI